MKMYIFFITDSKTNSYEKFDRYIYLFKIFKNNNLYYLFYH